jgi:hypothetical protein
VSLSVQFILCSFITTLCLSIWRLR